VAKDMIVNHASGNEVGSPAPGNIRLIGETVDTC